jgi:large subunit ribosomal protein L7/L12
VLGRLGVRANAYRLLDELLRAHEEPVPGPRPSEEKPRPGTFDVVLIDAGSSVIDLVRQIRDATGLGLADVKEVVFYPPRAIRRGLSLSEAEALRQKLETTGAKIDIRPVS